MMPPCKQNILNPNKVMFRISNNQHDHVDLHSNNWPYSEYDTIAVMVLSLLEWNIEYSINIPRKTIRDGSKLSLALWLWFMSKTNLSIGYGISWLQWQLPTYYLNQNVVISVIHTLNMCVLDINTITLFISIF